METFQALLAQKVAEALRAAGLPEAGGVTQATDARFGDYQSNAALILAKQLSENPRAIAQKILDLYDLWDPCEKPTIAGAGFINFKLRPEAIAVMRELGIDISGHRSKHVDEFDAQEFDYVITVCDNAGESWQDIGSEGLPSDFAIRETR